MKIKHENYIDSGSYNNMIMYDTNNDKKYETSISGRKFPLVQQSQNS